MNNDVLRARFEAITSAHTSGRMMLAAGRTDSGNYANPMLNETWIGFQLGYAVGMEDAAVVCDERAAKNSTAYAENELALFAVLSVEDTECAEAIRAKAKGEKP